MKNSDLARVVRRHLDAGHPERRTNILGPPSATGYFAVFHRTCGHTVLAGPDRDSLVSIIGNLRGSGRFALRIRIATRDDLDSVTRGITCNLCRGLA